MAGLGSKEGGGDNGCTGAATEGIRVYTNITNSNIISFTLAPSTLKTTFGAWVALDANTGDILWSMANPSNNGCQGPVTIANGVLFAGSMAPNGPFYVMDASTGEILRVYNTSATVYGGAAVSYGCVYIGSGYKVGVAKFNPTWTAGTSLYAFCVA